MYDTLHQQSHCHENKNKKSVDVNIFIFHMDLQQNPSGNWQMEWSPLTLILSEIKVELLNNIIIYVIYN